TRPARIVFDPITTVLARRDLHLSSRCQQFADWVAGLGGTVLLTASPSDRQVADDLRKLVKDSFCFDRRGLARESDSWLVFENSNIVADVLVEVDPSRGIFVSNRSASVEPVERRDDRQSTFETSSEIELPQTIELDAIDEGPLVEPQPAQPPAIESVE